MSRLQELPPELLANIARFAGGRYRKGEREYLSRKDCGDLLALRCASKAGKEAVRLCLTDHPASARIHFGEHPTYFVDARSIAAVGRVFGRPATSCASPAAAPA